VDYELYNVRPAPAEPVPEPPRVPAEEEARFRSVLAEHVERQLRDQGWATSQVHSPADLDRTAAVASVLSDRLGQPVAVARHDPWTVRFTLGADPGTQSRQDRPG
jgi:hypothetical protein